VISGKLFIDLKDRTIELNPQQGFLVPKGINHRTRAPERTAIMMVEGATVKPTGD
jgi:mannose-6-phosphate isomerase-like protein (cupin superfamily)